VHREENVARRENLAAGDDLSAALVTRTTCTKMHEAQSDSSSGARTRGTFNLMKAGAPVFRPTQGTAQALSQTHPHIAAPRIVCEIGASLNISQLI
jgi:hypothetical protein